MSDTIIGVKGSTLPSATSIEADDVFFGIRDGVTTKFSGSLIGSGGGCGIYEVDREVDLIVIPDEYRVEWILIIDETNPVINIGTTISGSDIISEQQISGGFGDFVINQFFFTGATLYFTGVSEMGVIKLKICDTNNTVG